MNSYRCFCFLAAAVIPGGRSHSPACEKRFAEYTQAQREKCIANGHADPDDGEVCSACCEHVDLDHGVCMDCGDDRGEHLAALAYDRAKERD